MIDDVSLTIGRGEFVAIMGPSGSGKSTLLNLLSCLDRADRGTIAIDGEDVGFASSDALAHIRNRKIGFVFQSFNLLPRSTVIDNVGLPLVYRGVAKAARVRAAAASLERLEMVAFAGRYPSQLSGGQKQRVAIARAVIGDPDVLMADEPTGALDSVASLDILKSFRGLADEGTAIVMVTHDHDAASHADRIVRMIDGRVASEVTE